MKNRRNFIRKLVCYVFVSGLLLTLPSVLASDLVSRLASVLASDSSDTAQPQPPARVYAVSPSILAVEVAAPVVTLGQQRAYEPKAGDEIEVSDTRSPLKRNGQDIGLLVGPDRDILYTYDKVASSAFQPQATERANNYAIASRSDPDYSATQKPAAVFRKSKPVALSRTAGGAYNWPTAHTLYLKLPQPLAEGSTYQLSFSGLGIEDTTFTYQPAETRSEAVHVSQLGFRPTDPFKAGYLSTWMGDGGGLDYPDSLTFRLIDTQSNQPVYRSSSTRRHSEQQTEGPRHRDYTLTEVHQLDFSSFNKPGEYRLCVEGVGCSFDFKINATAWDDAFYTAVRGLYHQRSGIAIGPPYSDFTRPRAFHPDEGNKVYQSATTLLEVDMGLGEVDAFEALLAGKTDTEVTDAWGGYFDAGDWDRRIQHLAVPRSLLELYSLFPDHFNALNLNLPESDNALPDMLDEALWSVDFFRRLQTPEGGIRGGIESAAHPIWGEASWQESLTVMAYAPDVWSSYVYAGVAARVAFTLSAYDSQLATVYQESALQAMAYAEANYVASDYTTGEKLHNVGDQRNLAALELYRLTRDSQWHDLFLSTTVFSDETADIFLYAQHDQEDAAFLYATLDGVSSGVSLGVSAGVSSGGTLSVDKQIQSNARAALLRRADRQVALTQTTAFGWSRRNPDAPLGWSHGIGAPTAINLLRAHALTGKPDYLQAGLSGTQFAAGANPDNLVFTTGLGDRSPQHPLIIDQRITGQTPPPGITLYGPADFNFYADYWVLDSIGDDMFPPPQKWPNVENYLDVFSNPMGAEYTVDYMVTSAYTWGYLAARED